MLAKIHKFLLVLTILPVLSGPAVAADALTPEQVTAIQDLIGQTLRDNPQIIVDAMENFRAKQEQDLQQQAEQKISENMSYLTSAELPSAGNPKGDVTVIEFFDYNCGYCKRAVPDIQKLVESDKNVRFVFQEMPILSDTSRTAAQWALAAHKQGKYFEYHVALMNHQGPQDESTLVTIAKDLGLDVDRMKKDAEGAEVAAALEKSLSVARDIGVNGTPAFIVNETLYPGYLGEDGLTRAIEKARETGDEKKG